MGCLTRAGDVRTGRGYLCDVVRRMFWNISNRKWQRRVRAATLDTLKCYTACKRVGLSYQSHRSVDCSHVPGCSLVLLLSQSVQGYSSREAHGWHADLLVCCALFLPHPRIQHQIPPILLHSRLSIINLPVKSAHTRLYLTSRKTPIMAEDSPFNRKTYGLPEDSRPFISDRTIREQRLKAARKTPRVSM